MKVLFMLNGLTHYFNLVTSKINEQPGIEVFYIHPRRKSEAMGEGVFETMEGVNFTLIELEEKRDAFGELYYDGLEKVLRDLRPKILMLAETHLGHLMNDKLLTSIIQEYQIKLVLKSIPFRVQKFDEAITKFNIQLQQTPLPSFDSFPKSVSKFLRLLNLHVLYKNWVLNKKARIQFEEAMLKKKRMYNFVDGHVNYIDEAYDIYGSYGVSHDKIFITYNSPDTDLYFSIKEKIKLHPPLLPPNPFRIIHLSRLVQWKRVDMLIKAVANLIEYYPTIELLIIGDGPEKESLKNMANELNVAPSIKFLGGVYDTTLFGRYIMSSSIYVLAGMGGLSINDAMIFGLPVICSVCDGTEKYLVQDGFNGFIFKDGDQDDLEEKIKVLFNNPQLCKEFGHNSEKIIKENINIKTVVERYINAFNSVAVQ